MRDKHALLLPLFLFFLNAPALFGWRNYNRFPLGADATGLGGAYVAEASDATALVLNPAGLPQLPESIVLQYEVFSSFEFADPLAWNVSIRFDTFPFFGVVVPAGKFRWGVSVATLYHSLLGGNDLAVRYLSGAAAYPVLDNLSVGVSVGPVLATESTGFGFSWAWTAGVLWKALDGWQFGASFRSPVGLDWSRTVKGGTLREVYPWNLDAGAAVRVAETVFLYGQLEWIAMDSVAYVLDGTDYAPSFGSNPFARLHPGLGVRFLESVTGAHLSFGWRMDSSYSPAGSVDQHLLTAGVRAYGKNLVFRASLEDALLIGLFYPGNVRHEKITASFSLIF